MKWILLLVFVTGLVSAKSYLPRPWPKRCNRSRDCSEGFCCRDEKGGLLDPVRWGHSLLSIGGENTGTQRSGTCSELVKGELCGGDCQCGPGLECYRPRTGVCCPPMRCETTEYVKKQNEYWDNCRPPTCFFPAK